MPTGQFEHTHNRPYKTTLQRRVFELVARVIRAELGDTPEGQRIAEAFAEEFRQSNEHFDTERFYRAAGVNLLWDNGRTV